MQLLHEASFNSIRVSASNPMLFDTGFGPKPDFDDLDLFPLGLVVLLLLLPLNAALRLPLTIMELDGLFTLKLSALTLDFDPRTDELASADRSEEPITSLIQTLTLNI
jgi:hypothetical protein